MDGVPFSVTSSKLACGRRGGFGYFLLLPVLWCATVALERLYCLVQRAAQVVQWNGLEVLPDDHLELAAFSLLETKQIRALKTHGVKRSIYSLSTGVEGTTFPWNWQGGLFKFNTIG